MVLVWFMILSWSLNMIFFGSVYHGKGLGFIFLILVILLVEFLDVS